MSIEFYDRYQALGIPYPDPKTMCQGQCEGTGYYPQHRDDEGATPAERAAWEAAEKAAPSDDGFHFIECPDCKGTGRRK